MYTCFVHIKKLKIGYIGVHRVQIRYILQMYLFLKLYFIIVRIKFFNFSPDKLISRENRHTLLITLLMGPWRKLRDLKYDKLDQFYVKVGIACS